MGTLRRRPCWRPRVVVVTVGAVDDAESRVAGLEALDGRVPTGCRDGVVGWVTRVDQQSDVPGIVLAHGSRGRLILNPVTLHADLVLVGRLRYRAPGDGDAARAAQPARSSGCARGRGRHLVRIVAVLARDVARHRVRVLPGLVH